MNLIIILIFIWLSMYNFFNYLWIEHHVRCTARYKVTLTILMTLIKYFCASPLRDCQKILSVKLLATLYKYYTVCALAVSAWCSVQCFPLLLQLNAPVQFTSLHLFLKCKPNWFNSLPNYCKIHLKIFLKGSVSNDSKLCLTSNGCVYARRSQVINFSQKQFSFCSRIWTTRNY